MYHTVRELYNKRFENNDDEHKKLLDVKKNKYNKKLNLKNLKIEDYDGWFIEEELGDMPLLESDEKEVKQGKGLKTVTPNKLLTRLSISLAQVKAGNNSCISIIKSPKKFTTN